MIDKKCIPIVVLFLFAGSFLSCTGQNAEIIFHSDANNEITLEGYNGFNRFSIAKHTIEAGSSVSVKTDYQGFILLTFKEGQGYPVIFSGDKLVVKLHDPNIPPEFVNSPENEFLYGYLSSYRKKKNTLLLLDETLKKCGSAN